MHATGRRAAHLILAGVIAGALVLAGCGQTGPLYLPDDETPEAIESSADDEERDDDGL